MTKNQWLRTYCRGLQIAVLNYRLQRDYKPPYETRGGVWKQTRSRWKDFTNVKRRWQPIILVSYLSLQVFPFFLMHYLPVYHCFSSTAFYCFFWITLMLFTNVCLVITHKLLPLLPSRWVFNFFFSPATLSSLLGVEVDLEHYRYMGIRGEYDDPGSWWYNLVLDRQNLPHIRAHTGECDHPCYQTWDISKQINIMGIVHLQRRSTC